MGTIICLPERGAGVGGVSFVRLLSPIFRHLRCAHSGGKSLIWKGLVCCSPSGHHYLPSGRRIWSGGSILCRVPFIVVVVLIIGGNKLLERYEYAAIPLDNIICVPEGGAGVD